VTTFCHDCTRAVKRQARMTCAPCKRDPLEGSVRILHDPGDVQRMTCAAHVKPALTCFGTEEQEGFGVPAYHPCDVCGRPLPDPGIRTRHHHHLKRPSTPGQGIRQLLAYLLVTHTGPGGTLMRRS
jgi:hypothetical protein